MTESTDYSEKMFFWNKNHSHPEYPDGIARGELRLHDTGMVFTFEDKKREPLIIHWKNLVSTYASAIGTQDKTLMFAWIVSQIPPVISVLTAGYLRPYSGSVSVKFKEVAMDKVVVIEFLSISPAFVIPPLAKSWANKLDSKIWAYKKSDRGLE